MTVDTGELRVVVSSGGREFELPSMDCPEFEDVSPGGDGPFTVVYKHFEGDTVPPGKALVQIMDDVGPVQEGRIARRDLHDLSQCDGPVSLVVEGWSAHLQDGKFDESTKFGILPGPLNSNTIQVSISRTPEGAISYTIGKLCPEFSTAGAPQLATTGFQMVQTKDFAGQPALDVVQYMSAVFQGSGTPILHHVRNRQFFWKPMDLAPKYVTSLANGAKVKPVHDAVKLYDRVVIVWGGGNVTKAPETLPQGIRNPVDLVINMSAEVRNIGEARQVADGLYARLQSIDISWACEVSIPYATAVEEIGVGEMDRPWRIYSGNMIRIEDMNSEQKFGEFVSISPEQWIVRRKVTKSGIVLTCGDLRIIGAVMAKDSPAGYAALTKFASETDMKAKNIPLSQPAITLAGGPATPGALVGHKTPNAVSYKDAGSAAVVDVVSPRNETPKPVTFEQHAYSDPGAAPFVEGLLNPSLYRDQLPPCKIMYYLFTLDNADNFTLELWLAARNAGQLVLDDNGRMTVGARIMQIPISAITKEVNFTEASAPRIEVADAIVLYKIVGTPAACKGFTFSARATRLAPAGFPVGHTDFLS